MVVDPDGHTWTSKKKKLITNGTRVPKDQCQFGCGVAGKCFWVHVVSRGSSSQKRDAPFHVLAIYEASPLLLVSDCNISMHMINVAYVIHNAQK